MSGESIGLSVVLPIRDQARAVRQTLESLHALLRARSPAGVSAEAGSPDARIPIVRFPDASFPDTGSPDARIPYPSLPSGWEILVVADGSDDEACREVIDFARGRQGVLLLRNPGPIGCGYATRQGVLLARGERILLVGPDPHAPLPLLDSMEEILEQGHDLVIASRQALQVRPLPPVRIRSEILSGSVDRSIRLLDRGRALRYPILFQLYHRVAAMEIFRRQKIDGASFTVEILYLARRYKYSVIEVPIPGSGRGHAAEDRWSVRAPELGELIQIRMNRLRGDYG